MEEQEKEERVFAPPPFLLLAFVQCGRVGVQVKGSAIWKEGIGMDVRQRQARRGRKRPTYRIIERGLDPSAGVPFQMLRSSRFGFLAGHLS